MKLNCSPIGKYIHIVDERNTSLSTTKLFGINIDKYFMPSVANIIGTNLKNYKLLRKDRFACNTMHVGRDEKMPIAIYLSDNPAIVSPAYFTFEVNNKNELDSEYLMIYIKYSNFDRRCWFNTDASVRGGISWEDFCNIEISIPEINEQRKIVYIYKAIEKRIKLLQKVRYPRQSRGLESREPLKAA